MQKGISTIMTVCLTFVVALALAAGGYYYINKQSQDDKAALQVQINTLTTDLAAAKKAGTTTTTSIAGWKTYTSATDKFSVKYPSTWVYDSSTPGILVFKASANDQWQFQIEPSMTDKTLQENFNIESSEKTTGGYVVTSTDITVGGVAAKKLHLGGEGVYGDTDILVVKNGRLYRIMLGSGADQTENAMLGTLVFMD